MAVYFGDMVICTCGSKTLALQLERLWAGPVCGLADRLSASENSRKTPLSTVTDLQDVRQSRNGDPEAYRRLIERHQAHVGRILWRFSRDRQVHEELVQDVFVEAYLSLDSFRGKAPFVHWLSRIATRVGYRYWKQTANRHKMETFRFQEWEQVADESANKSDPSQAAMLVHHLLAQLPPRDRLVLTLRYLEECDVAETARRTGWTTAMVKVQSWRARKKLKKLFAQGGRETIR